MATDTLVDMSENSSSWPDFDSLDSATQLLINNEELDALFERYPWLVNKLGSLTEKSLTEAFICGNKYAQREVQQALFNLYSCWMAEPLSAASRNQFNPELTRIKNALEQAWLSYEQRRYGPLPNNLTPENIVDQLRLLWRSHRASHHPLFDYLATDASEQQIYYFFKSDSALNLLFFDLVAMTLVGSLPETRGEISRNLWDEIGEGSNEFTHVNLYKDLLARREISLPDDHYTHLYDWQGLAGYNAFMLGGVTRQHYYKLIGVMAMTELLDPSQYEKLVAGCQRIGLTDRDVHYYSEHITIDIFHADGWLNNVIAVLAQRNPAVMSDIMFGAVLRLQTCNDYYDHLLAKLQKL